VFPTQEEKQKRFDIEIKRLIDSFGDEAATIRVQFMGDVVHLVGGRKFVLPSVSCEAEHLPKFITDKIALLKVHGARNYVDGVGKWLSEYSFYVDITPNEWKDFYESLPSPRRSGVATSV